MERDNCLSAKKKSSTLCGTAVLVHHHHQGSGHRREGCKNVKSKGGEDCCEMLIDMT